jgi:protein-disulfide isomerase
MGGIRRREVLLGAGAAWAATASAHAQAQSVYGPDDMTIGSAGARTTLIEYASSTCPHCREFYRTVWAPLKANYIDTGKIRYTFREYPTAPGAVAVAGFQVARCGAPSPDQYLERIGTLFEQQEAIFASGSMEGIRQKFVEIGAQYHLSEAQVMTCINDPAGADRINRLVSEGRSQFGVDGTPTLILNGQRLDDPDAVTYPGLSRLIDAAIAAHH